LGGGDKLAAVVFAEVEIHQGNVGGGAAEQIQGFGAGAAVAHHFEVGLGGQQAAQALAEQHVIVKQ
jgi:hypothetical protein